MKDVITRALSSSSLLRYLIASMVALLVDTGVLSIALRFFGMSVAWSATFGFTAGVLVAYALSVCWVFRERTYAALPALELITFLAVGLVGLVVTQLVLWLGVSKLQLLPELVKLVAAGATFIFNYLMRKSLLFVARGRIVANRGDVV